MLCSTSFSSITARKHVAEHGNFVAQILVERLFQRRRNVRPMPISRSWRQMLRRLGFQSPALMNARSHMQKQALVCNRFEANSRIASERQPFMSAVVRDLGDDHVRLGLLGQQWIAVFNFSVTWNDLDGLPRYFHALVVEHV